MAKYGFNVKIGADTRPFEEGIAKLGKSMQSVGKKLEKASSDLKVISAAAAGALVGIVKTSSDFEDAWVGVTKTVEGTEEELAKVRQEIIDMSKATGISKNEIAGVAQAAGQLGIATNDLSSFTKVMVDLGIATNMSAEEAAMSLARFANITQMSSKDYDRLGATITDLGNNFAVTEREIVDMATRLASTGDLVGLNQAQIMALATAMGSLGSESEAGGTAMSKMFRKIQLAVATNSKQLKQFAEVSGMSVNDFKKAFEQDALGALNSFVKGLAKIQDSGGSAIAKLDEMKLSEVRLSDATLRLVGSGDLLDRSIATANKAWEENTALTKEAEKRYNELKYQWGKLKETLGELAIRLGDVLLPTLKKVVSNVTKWITDITKKLDNMSKFEKENLLKILALIASISPALKVVGSSITLLGKTIRGLANPTTLATTALLALVAGVYAYAKAQEYEMYGLKGLKDTLDEERESWNKTKEARQDAVDSAMAEMGVTENLVNNLDKIVDENGKVKEGYEDRAKFIITELNNALGTEMTLNEGVISGYKDLRGEIDKLIRSKKAEMLLEAYKEEYTQALKDQAKATDHLIELQDQWSEANKKAWSNDAREAGLARQQRAYIAKQIKEQTDLVGEYGYTIQNYEALQAAAISGSVEEIEKASEQLTISYEKNKTASEESINAEIANQQKRVETIKKFLDESLKNHDEYQASVYQTQLESEEKQLSSLYESLVKQTATVNELTPDQVAAFETLAKNNLGAYQYYVKQLPPEMQEQLSEVTGIINTNTSVESATDNMSQNALSRYTDIIGKMPMVEESVLENTASTINANTTVPDASGGLGEKTTTSFKENADGEGAGANFNAGVERGINNNQGGAIGAAVGFAAKLLSAFSRRLDEHSPSKETERIGKYFVQGFTNGIIGSQLSAVSAVQNLAGNTLEAYQSGLQLNGLKGRMTNDMLSGTKTIYTTPNIVINTQQLDDQKLEQIVEYVDRRFGASY